MNQAFMDKLTAAGLTRQSMGDSTTYIILGADNQSTQEVDAAVFWTLFADVEANPTHDALSGSHTFTWLDGQTYTRTASELGYQSFFDDWKAKGIIG